MAQRHPVEEHQVLVNLPHVAHVGHDGQVELLGQQADGNELADAADARAIDLDEVGGAGLHVVLEEHPVRNMLAGGHVLLEGVPGLAKTLTAKLLARTVDTGFSRSQFRPDLMPSDVIGTSVFDPRTSTFEFKAALGGYETGKVDFATLLDAQRQIRQARQNQLKAQVDAQMRLAEIERLLGEDL